MIRHIKSASTFVNTSYLDTNTIEPFSLDDIAQVITEDIEENDTTKATLEALLALGFTRQEILKVINGIEDKNIPVEKMISLCLRKINK